ncbi:MAG: hypothetical protein HYR96_11575 [Deltaproteobacteria bacterium]|nr:hypothetical protein [Deltaproteobacteria bacterium]MBI3294942.1 hypothetical protein [Deltaproteobacteria bacterium]
MENTRLSQLKSQSLVLGNLFGGLGSGAVVAKGLIPENFPPSTDSILAYLIGSALSLAAILGARRHITQVGKFLSVANVVVVIAMLFVYRHPGAWTPWLFFTLFATHFALVFVPRTFRTDLASTEASGSLSLVELGYSIGTTVGLTLWERIGVSFAHALAFSGVCYAVAALCDSLHSGKSSSQEESSSGSLAPSHPLLPMAMLLLVALTLGIQISVQMISKHLASTIPLAAFEVGVTLAPIVLLSLKGSLVCGTGQCLGMMRCSLDRLGVSLPLGVVVGMALGLSGLGALYPAWASVSTFFAAYLYETLALMIFGWMGRQGGTGNVAMTFGVMAVSAMALYGAFLHMGSGIDFILVSFVVSAIVSGGAIVFKQPSFSFRVQEKSGA